MNRGRLLTGLLVATLGLLCPGPVSAQIDMEGKWTASRQEDFVHRVPGPLWGTTPGFQ